MADDLSKASRNVREQRSNITPEQATDRRIRYARSIGLNPMYHGSNANIPQSPGGPNMPYSEQFGVEHETAHAMMAPPDKKLADYHRELTASRNAGFPGAAYNGPAARNKLVQDPEYQAHVIGTQQENVANHLEYDIDRRAGVGQKFSSEYRGPTAPKGASPFDIVDHGDPELYTDKTYLPATRRDSEGMERRVHNAADVQVAGAPIRQEAKQYVGQFDEGARFDAQGRIQQPSGINATINRRAKAGPLAALRERARGRNLGKSMHADLAKAQAAVPEWKGRPILHLDHAGEIDQDSAINEMMHRMPREQADEHAYQAYVRDQRVRAAAHHYKGMRAALASGDSKSAHDHALMYELHAKALGHDGVGAPPPEVQAHVVLPEGPYKFRAHKADAFEAVPAYKPVHVAPEGAVVKQPEPITKSELWRDFVRFYKAEEKPPIKVGNMVNERTFARQDSLMQREQAAKRARNDARAEAEDRDWQGSRRTREALAQKRQAISDQLAQSGIKTLNYAPNDPKHWHADFRREPLVGDKRFKYLPFHEMAPDAQEEARRRYTLGAMGAGKYHFIHEHYLYPTTSRGKLAAGYAKRELAIPYDKLSDDAFMSSIGYGQPTGEWQKQNFSDRYAGQHVSTPSKSIPRAAGPAPQVPQGPYGALSDDAMAGSGPIKRPTEQAPAPKPQKPRAMLLRDSEQPWPGEELAKAEPPHKPKQRVRVKYGNRHVGRTGTVKEHKAGWTLVDFDGGDGAAFDPSHLEPETKKSEVEQVAETAPAEKTYRRCDHRLNDRRCRLPGTFSRRGGLYCHLHGHRSRG